MLITRLLWPTLGFVSAGALMGNFVFRDLWLDRNKLSSQLKQFDALDSRLSKLELDQVQPFRSETTVSILEEELGGPVDDIFDQFDYEPIDATSLGQNGKDQVLHESNFKELSIAEMRHIVEQSLGAKNEDVLRIRNRFLQYVVKEEREQDNL